MIKKLESLGLFSKDATALANFYKQKVGLKVTEEAEMGEKGETKLFAFEMEETGLYIVDSDQVDGQNPQPARIIFNLEVDNIEQEAKKLEEAGVKKIADIYHVENYGLIATFEDLDGNYFQLVQVKES